MNYLLNKNNICAIIPFFNEVQSLPDVISETSNFVNKIILVNDDSTDGSERINFDKTAFLINHKSNLGKGAALKTGFKKALEFGYKYSVTLDADGQHDPKYIPNLVEKLSDYDIVIGNRMTNLKNMPLLRRISNKLTSRLLSFKTNMIILDSQSGYRAYKTEVLEKLLPSSNGFEAESEIIIKAARNKLKIGFVNIPTIYGNDSSKMKSGEAILGFIKILFY